MLDRRNFLKTVGIATGTFVCGGIPIAKSDEHPKLNYIHIEDYIEYHEVNKSDIIKAFVSDSRIIQGIETNIDGKNLFIPLNPYQGPLSIEFMVNYWIMLVAKLNEIKAGSKEDCPISKDFEVYLKTKNIGLFKANDYLFGINLDITPITHVFYTTTHIGIYSPNITKNIVCAKIKDSYE